MGILIIQKLISTIRTTFKQFMTLLIVIIVGTSLHISLDSAFENVTTTVEVFHTQMNFADYFIDVKKAPENMIRQINEIQGIEKAVGRIQKDVQVILKDHSKVTGRITSYKKPMEDNLNKVYLKKAKISGFDDFSGRNILLDRMFAESNEIKLGDKIKINTGEKIETLNMVGIGIGPEFHFVFRSPLSWCEMKTFGIIMISQKEAERLLDMEGSINQVLIKFLPNADEEKVIEKTEKILEQYGILTSYNKNEHPNHKALKENIGSLKVASYTMSIIFLMINICFLFILLTQIIKAQRLQIGIMKAIGVDNKSIMMIYVSYCIMVTVIGSTIGIIGASYISKYFVSELANVYNLPYVIEGITSFSCMQGMLISISSGIVAALLALRQIVRINPAEAIRRAVPKIKTKSTINADSKVWAIIPEAFKMTIRVILRNKIRFFITSFAIACAVLLLIVTMYYKDSEDYLMYHHYEEENLYDAKVHFSQPIKKFEINDWNKWEQIKTLEPALEIPVQITNVKEKEHNKKSEDMIITGLERKSYLKSIYNTNLEKIHIPEHGIFVSINVAKKLGLKVGDMVEIETKLGVGRNFTMKLKVMGICKQFFDSTSIASLEVVNKIIHEKNTINTAFIKIGNEHKLKIEDQVNEMQKIEYVLRKNDQKKAVANFLKSISILTTIATIAGCIMGFAMVYTTSLMNFNNRIKELASLKVIGFSDYGISKYLFYELFLEVVLGIVIGIPLGRIIGRDLVESISSEYVIYPIYISLATHFIAIGITISFALFGHIFAMRAIKKMNMVDELRNRD